MTEAIEGTLEPKARHGSPDWLLARHRDVDGRARLTASIAGVVVDGSHEFIRPSDLAIQQLRDEPPDEEMTEAMERGHALEPALLDHWAAKHGAQIERPEHMFVRGRWLANLDGVCWEKDAPVEAKTTNHRYTGLLPYWVWQGVAQRWCFAGMPGWVHWVILDGDLRFHFHDQFVEQADIDRLLDAGAEWLSYVDLGMPPLGVSLDAKQVAALYPGEGAVELPAEARDWVEVLRLSRAAQKQGAEEEKAAKDWLAQHLAGKDVGTIDGQVVVTWKEQAGRLGFDKASFRREYPDLAEKFEKRSAPFRVMRMKGES